MTGNFTMFAKAVLRRAALVLAFVALTAGGGFAQSRSVTGVVKDAQGPVLAATVVVVGTSVGVSTGIDGGFAIDVPADARQLRVTYIGYDDATVDLVASQTHYEILLAESSNVMDEVVVVGYGVQKRSDLTGAVSSVGSKVLEAMPVSSAAEAISGRMAGVSVTSSEGGPDAEIKVRVRGGGSITQDNSPLFIVDGFPVSTINDIAPGDIQSIDVLKDASSTAIYGARGANGVVIVTTKSGKAGRTSVSLNAYFGWKYLANELDVLDGYGYTMLQYEMANDSSKEPDKNSSFMKYYGAFGDLELYRNRPSTDWQEEIFGRTGFTQNYNASITGGSEKIKYNIGLTHMDDQSIMIGSGFMRNNLNLKLQGNLAKGLRFDVAARYSHTAVLGAGTSTEGGSSVARLKHAVRYMPTTGLADFSADGDDYITELINESGSQFLNPVDITNDEYRRQTKSQQTYNGALTWTIVKPLTFRTEWGVEMYDEHQDQFWGLSTSTARNNHNEPVVRKYDRGANRWRGANTLTYADTFDGRHSLTVMVGQELNSYRYDTQTVEARYFPRNTTRRVALANLSLGTAEPLQNYYSPQDNMLSFFGRVNYSYDERYLFTASLRADGSSKFADGNRWGYFPSAAFAWRLSQERFMEGAERWLSNLKLRLSYGASGNNRITDGLYRAVYATQLPSKPYAIGGVEQTIMTMTYLPNPSLKWETTITRNVGIDFGFFGNRLSGSVDAYWNTTKDLLINASIPSATGYSSQYQNIGRTSNKGIEVVLDGVLVDKKDFRLSLNANLSWNRNRVDELGEATYMEASSRWLGNITGDYRVTVGESLGRIYGYRTDGFYTVEDFDYVNTNGTAVWTLKEGVTNTNAIYGGAAQPGAMKLRDLTGDGKITDADREVIGCALPVVTGGFSLSANIYGFDLAAYFNYSVGNDVYNANKIEFTSYADSKKYGNMLALMKDRFTYIDRETGVTLRNDYDALAAANAGARIWSPLSITKPILTDWAVEDGSFLRLSNVTLGYTLPKKYSRRIGMENLRLYVTGTNLWLLTSYSGYDPEVDTRRSTPLTPGVDYSAFPRARQFVVGANITF